MLVALLVLGACGGGSDSSTASTAPTTLPPVAAGRGTVTLGGDSQAFTVNSCEEGESAPGGPALARVEFQLLGTGTDGTTSFSVTVSRVTSDSGVGSTNITETAIIATGTGADEKGLVARRTQIKSVWLDLNQRSVKSPLIVRKGRLVEVTARFGPDGGREGEVGIVPGQIRARCPS